MTKVSKMLRPVSGLHLPWRAFSAPMAKKALRAFAMFSSIDLDELRLCSSQTPRHFKHDCVLMHWPATFNVWGIWEPLVKTATSVLSQFSVREFVSQKALRQFLWISAALGKLERARRSSACADVSRCSPKILEPWLVASRFLNSESMTMEN